MHPAKFDFTNYDPAIIFSSLRDRLSYYSKRSVRKTLTVEQYTEILDSRIILGINTLFYVCSVLPLYVSFCHILLFDVSDDVFRVSNLMLVVNSTFKLYVYLALSWDFRRSVLELFFGERKQWAEDEAKAKQFLAPARVAACAQADTATYQPLHQNDDDDD